jgi:hypothetical protein
LSRHRKIKFIRSKAIVLAAAGAFTVATAATAVAATWPQGSSGPVRGLHDAPAGAGIGASLTVTDQMIQTRAVSQTTAGQALNIYQARSALAELAATRWQAAQARAAKEAAAARAAAQTAAEATAQAQAQATAPSTGAPQPTQTASTPAAPAPSGSPQQIAEAMLGSFGWSSSQFSCLDPLWEHESGWSVTAYNAGSGAYGIPQALPGSRMAGAGPDWQTNAATQVRWGLEYIKGTYGSPCAAWDHEQATGWY